MTTFPKLSSQLVEDLATQHPPRCKRPGESEEEHQRYAGKVDLIQKLLREMNPE